MNFLNPAVLFGLIAASIPLILHLLNLRKLKRVEFSSLKFIKELQKTKIRRIKLKQIILLILRTLIIVFIVLAFSRPTIESNLPLIGTYAKSSVVILLDNSFSLDVSDEYGSRYNQAKNTAMTIINSLQQGDKAVVIPMSGYDDENYTLSSDKELVRDDLLKINIRHAPASLRNSLVKAYNTLEKSNDFNNEIYIITDAQQNIFADNSDEKLELYNPRTKIFLVHIGGESNMQISNFSVDSLRLMTKIFHKDKPIEIEAVIKNNSANDVSGLVVSLFYNSERTTQRALDIPANQSRTIRMSSEPKEFGIVKAYLELEHDALDRDNRRYFAYLIPEKPSIAVFGSKSFAYPIETVFNINSNPVNIKSFTPTQISSIDLNKYDLIIITDKYNNDIYFNKIKSYIESGGSTLLFADNEPKNLPAYLNRLKSLGIEADAIDSFSEDDPLEFNYTDKSHPIFQGVFKNPSSNKKHIESPKMFKILKNLSGQNIIGTSDGNFLSEIRLGSGKLFFVSISLAGTWSDFTITGLFPVFIYRSAIYLTASESQSRTVISGQKTRIIIEKKFSTNKPFEIEDPNGEKSYIEAVNLPSSSVIEPQGLDAPGVYTIKSANGKIVKLLTVNHAPSESQLKKLSKEKIISNTKKMIDSRTELKFLQQNQLISGFSRARTGTELWQLFIALALISALAEMLVARTSKNDIVNNKE